MAFLTQNETKTSVFLRDKERISKRFQTNFEAIIAKYDRPFVESDVLDLNNLTVVEDRGFLSRTKKSRIGTTKLAADKISPHKATRWDSTKDSTDSAFGSTRLSESEDTSGTETTVNYTYQNPIQVNEEERERAVLRMDDVLMRGISHSEDSGNEDVESDHSGPISTPTRSSLTTLMHHQGNRDAPTDPTHGTHRRARGNLSKKFEDEYQVKKKKEREMFKELSEDDDDDEKEEEEEDPYEFKDELPSILEERNRFLFKMQSILADSFSDEDGIDEMDSPSDGEASTGTIESSVATSGSISAWSTLQSKPTPKRTSKTECIPLRDQHERILDGLTITSTDSDYTECSTILAGNLHSDQQLFRPSNLLSRANQNRDSTSSMSQPPFEAICNSTMLSEIQPPALGTAKRKPQLDLDRHRGLELPLDKEGEMYLGVVPFDAQCKPEARTDDDQTKSPKFERSSEYRTPVKYDDSNRKSVHISLKSTTPTTRNHSHPDSIMSPGDCDVSCITPRARLRKAVKVNRKTSLPSPRFNTQEIIEIFRSPKPLIIPGINVDSLDLTPRRRVKREGTGAPSTGPLKNALLCLQIPSSKEEKSTDHRSHTAKEIIIESNNSACEMTLDCTRLDSESHDDQEGETLVSKSNVCSDDRPNQTARTPNTPVVVETASDRKHHRKVVETNGRLKESTRELKTSAPTRKDKSMPKGIHISTRQTDGSSSSELLNVTELQGKHPEVCGAELRETDSQVRQTVHHHHRSSQSTDALELNTDMNSVSPKSNYQRTGASTKLDTRRKGSEHKLSKPRQLPVQSENNTGKKSTQKSKHPKEKSAEDVQEDSMNRSSKTPKVKRSILTPTVQRSPSILSSPLNRMSLASPLATNGPVKGQLPKGSDKKTSAEQAVRKKQKKLSEGHPKTRRMAENLRLNDRRRTSEEFNSTHMTIRDFDDDSEDEMEVDVDPYSLTADDSSPGPSHFHRRHTAYSKGKPAPLTYNDRGGNTISGKDKLRSSQTRANHLSQKFQGHDRDLDINTKTPTKRYRHPRQSESCQKDLRYSENDGEFGQSSPIISKKGNVLANKTAVLNDAASLPVNNNSSTASNHGERKLVARAEHSLDFSDEESNSSGDSAKFLSLVSNCSVVKTCDSEPEGVPVAIPEDNKRSHVGSYKIKHKTIIRCGQIISSPKSTKSISRGLHSSSPPRTGRVEKSRKMYANSPTRSFQSDTKSVRNSTTANQRGQPAKTVARRLIASPMKKLDDHANSGNARSLGSSPLRSSGCNVSSSYMCEGPGHCTKPFCFSCALSELS